MCDLNTEEGLSSVAEVESRESLAMCVEDVVDSQLVSAAAESESAADLPDDDTSDVKRSSDCGVDSTETVVDTETVAMSIPVLTSSQVSPLSSNPPPTQQSLLVPSDNFSHPIPTIGSQSASRGRFVGHVMRTAHLLHSIQEVIGRGQHQLPARSRGRAPGQGVRGTKPP